MLSKLNFKNPTQQIMFEVIISLLPAVIYKAYSIGYIAVFALCTLLIMSIITEKLCAKILKIDSDLLDFSSIITALLLFLALNPNMTILVYMLAAIAAIGLGKMVYGGFAKNIFNPAMVGWCFVMVSFPQFMTKHLDYNLALNFQESLGVFFNTISIDSYTSATPLDEYKPFHKLLLKTPEIFNLNMLVLAGGLYLLGRKIISYIFPLAMAIGVAFGVFICGFKFIEACHLFFIYGPIILAAFYIITDPVSSPSIPRAQTAYSFAIGLIAILIAKYCSYPIGVAFAVLFVNSFNFILDKAFMKGESK